MREIKFRARDTKDKVIRDVVGISLYHETLSVDIEFGKYLQDDIKRFELMQYTGLKDKNGAEIYEGDILSTDLSRPYLIVEFRNGAFMYQCHDGGRNYYDFMEPANEGLKFNTKYHEVIGNIYENPELLERK